MQRDEKAVMRGFGRGCRCCIAVAAVVMIMTQTTDLMAAVFTAGNIVVERVGDGVTDLSVTDNSAFPVFVDEFTTAGGLAQTIAMPTSVSGNQRALTETGSRTGDGYLTLSANGRYLVVPGYDATPGSSDPTLDAGTTTARVVGRIDYDGTIDTSTALSDAFTTDQFRSVTSRNGKQFWMVGQNGAAGGLRYVANLGDSTSVDLNDNAANNVQAVHIFDGQLYIGSRAPTPGRSVFSVGTGLPKTGAQTLTPTISPASTNDNMFEFVQLDLNPAVAGFDTIYAAIDEDDGPGLTKYELIGGVWTFLGLATRGPFDPNVTDRSQQMRGLEAIVQQNGDVVLYLTSGERENNGLLSYTDATGLGGSIAGNNASDFTLLASAGDNYVFRGVDLAPVLPEPSTVLLLGIMSAAVLRRSRL